MNTSKKRLIAFCLIPFLVWGLLLSGCSLKPQSPTSTTASTYSNENSSGQADSEEAKLAAQKQFNQLMDQIFQEELSENQLDLHFLLKNPKNYGITGSKRLYSDPSSSASRETINQLKDMSDKLDTVEERLLTDSQKLTARILRSFISTELKSEGFELYAQPLAPTIGIQAQLPILLSEYQFYEKQDIDDYLSLLAGIDEYYQEILTLEQEKADAGLMMNDTTLSHVIESCESYLLVPGDNFMIDTFKTRLDNVQGLTEEERAAYEQQNAAVLESDFVPGYQMLIDTLTTFKGTAKNTGGLAGYPEGKAYYEYLVYSNTGTSYESIDAMLNAMEDRLDQDLREVTRITKAQPELLAQVNSISFRQTDPDSMLTELKTLTQADFPPLPQCNYTLKDVPKALELSLSPAFYLTPPIDDYQNNVIYINHNDRFTLESIYPTIAHEGYPGHLYQNVYFRSSNAHPIRQILAHTGFAEGWATYVERYAYTLDNGLNPDMGKLLASNTSASLGLQACLDVYINYEGWTVEQVKKYLDNFYDDSGDLAQVIYDTMIENPSNYLSYYVGFLEIQNMKELAEAELGSHFSLKEFHTFLMDLGPAPFDVIQPYFSSWLLKQKM